MPLQHYLPATYLALFSKDLTYPRRNRKLFVGDKLERKIFEAPVSVLAARNNFYKVETNFYSDPLSIDKHLSTYEKDFLPAIEKLINRKLDALTWARTLVPFVTGLLVRGPDFNERFEKRLAPLFPALGEKYLNPSNTNHARLMEHQRFLAPVATAQWTVSSIESEIPLITNDLGYAPFGNPETKEMGLAVPIGPKNVLTIVPKRKNILAFSKNGGWLPYVAYVDKPVKNHEHLNGVLAHYAGRFVFGSEFGTVQKSLRVVKKSLKIMEPGELGFLTGRKASEFELMWFRLVAALSLPPTDDETVLYSDFNKPDIKRKN